MSIKSGSISRKSPTESATAFTVGTIKKGNDKEYYVVTKTNNGVQRWIPKINALNKMKLLTIDYLSKNINKPIKLYLREYLSEWPKKSDWVTNIPTHTTIIFKPTGNAILGKKVLDGWLKTKDTKDIKEKSDFSIEGYINFYPSDKTSNLMLSSLQVDTKNKKIVSVNLMNTEVFVMV
jgi:hypothetical protein